MYTSAVGDPGKPWLTVLIDVCWGRQGEVIRKTSSRRRVESWEVRAGFGVCSERNLLGEQRSIEVRGRGGCVCWGRGLCEVNGGIF